MPTYDIICFLIEKQFFRTNYAYDSYCELIKKRLQSPKDTVWLDEDIILNMLFYPIELSATEVKDALVLQKNKLKFLLDKEHGFRTTQLLNTIAEIYLMKKIYALTRHKKVLKKSSPIIYQMD